MYHISDIKKYERCPRSFWLSRSNRKNFIPFVNYNENMSELCKELLMIAEDNAFVGKVNDDGALALGAYKEKKTLINARFAYEDVRIKVPFLLCEEDKTILYFTYTNCYPKESEAQGMADTISVLEALDINVDEVYAIHLNHEYIRKDSLDVKELFIINDCLYNNKNKAHKTIQDLLAQDKRDIKPLLAALRACEESEDVKIKRTTACTRGNKCPYYEDCFRENVEDSSVLSLVQSAHKYDMKEDGIQDLKDVDIKRIEGTRHQYAQIMADKLGGCYVDKGALTCWINEHISYPISYLDFEWETFAYPPYKGMRPFDVLAFQYSLHIEEKDGDALQHVNFIAEGDCREAFVVDLLAHVPKTGTILVYNMEGAEKLRLRQLAQQFPQYEKELEQIWERMLDLSLPFSTGNVYDVRMRGFYSLKTLVPIFSDYNYQDLAISYGMDAVEAWRLYEKSEPAEKAIIYQQLSEYCSMDTYAEYIVYHALKKLAKA
ncbi:MAG: DUF2779 domain-containing protein [Longicatena sp.]